MKTNALMWMVASAIVLTFSQPASADPGRVEIHAFEFYALGQGDLIGFCLNQPTNPPEVGPLGSCVRATPAPGEDHVEIDVRDSQGNPVYFTVGQGGGFGWGCGTITSHPGGLIPLSGSGSGGGPEPVLVFPWAGPGLGNFPNTLDPNDICWGSLDANLVQPGVVGTVTFTFHNHVAP